MSCKDPLKCYSMKILGKSVVSDLERVSKLLFIRIDFFSVRHVAKVDIQNSDVYIDVNIVEH